VVITLGGVPASPANAAIIVSQRFRILQGQQLHLVYMSNYSPGARVRAWARVVYDNGVDSILYVPDQTLTGDRIEAVLTPSEVAVADGWVTDAVVEMLSANIRRGQVYVQLVLAQETRIFGTILCSDYCFSGFGEVALGTYIQPGPGGGGGHLHWLAIKAIGAPAATTTYSLSVSNTIRLLREFIWYYHCSADVATRTLRVHLKQPGGGLPTGYGSGDVENVWVSTVGSVSLTADQDGSVFADPQRSGNNDNGALTIQSTATLPTPFPILVSEEGGETLEANVVSSEVLDVDVIWGLFEDWLVPTP